MLIVALHERGWLTYQIRCLVRSVCTPGRYCQAYKPCGCPQSQVRDEWGGETWFDFEGDDTAHGVVHRDIAGEWIVPDDDRCFFELVPAEVAEAAGEMPVNGNPPGPGVYLVEPVYESGCGSEDGFTLRWAGAARLQMIGDLFHGCRPHPDAIYIGRNAPHWRRSQWHNPFKAGKPIPDEWAGLADGAGGVVVDGAHAVRLFDQMILCLPGFRAQARADLAQKMIFCWCGPDEPCHGDPLMILANTPAPVDNATKGRS